MDSSRFPGGGKLNLRKWWTKARPGLQWPVNERVSDQRLSDECNFLRRRANAARVMNGAVPGDLPRSAFWRSRIS
jgi:hypothetical protein